MGRITIFAVDDCIHCTRVKSALEELEIPHTEISLSTHPARRLDVLALTDKMTLPQVFLNEKHIGGADDTLDFLQANWMSDPAGTAQEYFWEEVASLPDPTDPRLQPSTEAPAVEPSRAPTRPKSDRITLPDGSASSHLEMVEGLRDALPCQVHKSKSKICKQSFTGAQAATALCKEYKLPLHKAVQFGEYLRQALVFHSVLEDVGEFVPNEKAIYRLQCYHTPHVLNSYRVWNTVVDPDYMGLLRRLKQLLGKVEKQVTSAKRTFSIGSITSHTSMGSSAFSVGSAGSIGDTVNYALARTNRDFCIFEEAVCELQRVNLSKLDANTTKAFGINLYNLMIQYAFFKLGVTSSSRSRSAFFNGVKFNVGGEIFSFQDWEHGFLRGNRKAPYSLKPQFGRKDPRLACALKEVDCRLHFALNCGAKSCPPMRTFTADGIEEELRIVSQAFCEDEDNVEINVQKRSLCLNKILSWYRVDFAPSEKELPAKILEYLRGEKRAQLRQLLADGKAIHVSYKKYDWSTNASDFVPFDSAVLRADIQRIGFRFKFKKSSLKIG